jgi:ribosomal protein L3
VVQVKTKEKDGYSALQLGIGSRKRINKPLAGTFKGSGFKNRPLIFKGGKNFT